MSYEELKSDLQCLTLPTAPVQEQPMANGTHPIYRDSPATNVATVNVMPMSGHNASYTPVVGPRSMALLCPNCKCSVKTNVRHRATTKTHLACVLLCWTCCCCCLPYCMDTCRNANHFCPICETFLGTYQS